MKIEMKEITIREIVDGYVNNDEKGVVGYKGKLNIRPPFQREFCYSTDKQQAVIHTIMRGFPLNVMYWGKNNDGTFEIIDGQQRTVSFCKFFHKGGFEIPHHGKNMSFFDLTEKEKEQILNYKIMVYICEGTDDERLNWFKVINTAGETLKEQELLNAQYTGEWLSDAKAYFSKSTSALIEFNKKYVGAEVNRQGFLETALSWVSGGKENIKKYMEEHQNDKNAEPLYEHFDKIIKWVEKTFPNYHSSMQGIEWGRLYDEYHNEEYDIKHLQEEIERLRYDEEVTNTKGIYEYVLSRGTKNTLSLRKFSNKIKEQMYRKQGGFCPITRKKLDLKDMDAHHIDAWENGGKTIVENCVLLERTAHNKLHTECTHKPFEVREMRDKLIEDVKNGIM